jgi:hypothetical protein
MKEKYIFKDLEVLEFSEVLEESEDSSLLLRAYARIPPVDDGGCGSDGGTDGGPPYC